MSKIPWLGIPMLCPIGVEYGRSEWPGRETKITHKLCLVVGVPWPSHTSGGGRRVNLAPKLWRLRVTHSLPAMKVCPKRMKQRRVSFAQLCFRLQTMWSLQRVGKIPTNAYFHHEVVASTLLALHDLRGKPFSFLTINLIPVAWMEINEKHSKETDAWH
jgi:hypothetical protein